MLLLVLLLVLFPIRKPQREDSSKSMRKSKKDRRPEQNLHLAELSAGTFEFSSWPIVSFSYTDATAVPISCVSI